MNEEKIEDKAAKIVADIEQNSGESGGHMYSSSLPNDGVKEESVLKRIVAPHLKVSRLVTDADVEKVVEEAKILHAICYEQNGLYRGAYAMHHSQIEAEDPMKLFVVWDKSLVINPTITRHSNYTKDSKEACMSFPMNPEIIVPRYQKIEVEFTTIMSDPDNAGKFKLSSPQTISLSGPQAFIWQHEIDHGEGKLIYPIIKKD